MRDMISRISLISVISAISDSDDVSESDESWKLISLSCSVRSGLMMTLTSPSAAALVHRLMIGGQAGRAGQGRAGHGRAATELKCYLNLVNSGL